MLLLAAAGLPPIVAFLWAADTSADPSSLLYLLGPFGAAALFALLWIKYLIKLLDRMLAIQDTWAPTMVELRDALKATAAINQAATKAMESMAEGLRQMPTAAEMAVIREIVQGVPNPGRPHPWRT